MSDVPSEMMRKAEEHLKCFSLDDESILKISRMMDSSFGAGLQKENSNYLYSPLKMVPTWLSVVPDGSERGRFFAIDLGGTNLRFFEIDLVEGELTSDFTLSEVPHEAMTGDADTLFDFIAEKIRQGLIKVRMVDREIHYFGFTFSFAVNQTSLTSGSLIRWTKGYSASGVVGKDVCALLKNSCRKLGLKIDKFVLINDTTGTLMSGAYGDRDAKIGIINGTGTNACYLENAARVSKWLNHKNEKHVIINTEWGAFGECGELDEYLTEYDKALDRDSLRPREYVYEKAISGMYLGELARLIILKFTEMGLLFGGIIPEPLKVKDSFPSTIISFSYNPVELIKEFNTKFNVSLTPMDVAIIGLICDKISLRAAKLTSAGLITILNRIDSPTIAIAGDGSMFRKHPMFVNYMIQIVSRLVHDKTLKVVMADDGSGKGAALAAAVATISEQRKIHQTGCSSR